ncbi:hypothetical protein JCM10212_001876 [Sporobolomyces blumeae]
MATSDDVEASEPAPPPALTKAQRRLILAAPIHRQIRLCVYSTVALSTLECLVSLFCVVYSSIVAKPILQDEKWFIFHYTAAATFSLAGIAYVVVYFRDVKFFAWPDQLKIDAGWITFANGISGCFFFYIYYKMRTYGTIDALGEACVDSCNAKLAFVRISPLVVPSINIALGLVQIFLLVIVYRNPIVNPPLDEHGMPVPVNPLTGEVLPLDQNGKPILPPELRPPALSTASSTQLGRDVGRTRQKTSKRSARSRDGSNDAETESGSGSDSDEEKTLLDADGAGTGQSRSVVSKELGRADSSSRRSRRHGQRQR